MSERYNGQRKRLRNTLLGRIYSRLYSHPVRFYGDLQSTGITNYHRRLKEFVDSVPESVWLLDLGSGARHLRKQGIINLDIRPFAGVHVCADAHRLPLADAVIDAAVVQMVLEHVQKPDVVLAEVFRILRPGGKVYVEVPFLFPMHDRIDYRRWTLEGLAHLCNGFQFQALETGICIGPFSALSALIRRLLTLYALSLHVEAALDLMLGWLLWPLKYLDQWLPPASDAQIVAGGVYFVGTKDSSG